ncbi:hypothetical protein [Entomobacter blattae]|uniref:DUF1134 domain-containing protein n=1 Tax=Entomobacter blattae TaxID=2762277 RepID=A0A7H1NRY8_9PROT|nr:hypothetical protein [Entomobacter blattae]QNT78548.1 hypothetical protein JGUZn3_13220 [Entomobacter blattae]
MRHLVMVLGLGLAGTSLLPATLPSAHAASSTDRPVGTVYISIKSADVGVGYTWGEGTLHYGGKSYKFSIDGGDLVAVGYSNIAGSGKIYNLHDIRDFEGDYAAVNGEATAGRGQGVQILKNDKGVEIQLDTQSRGARLAGALQGFSIELNDDND